MAQKTAKKMKAGERGGFTIIEVVLVLAIAGLIFLMVFVALPQLQRSQRDTQRRDDLARVATAITQYQTNNNGKLPSAGNCEPAGTAITDLSASGCKLIKDYLNSTNATENEFVDPDGTVYKMQVVAQASRVPSSIDFSGHKIYIAQKSKCNGEQAVASSNARDYAILYKLEGAGTYCADNQ